MVSVWGMTDKGIVRRENQDSCAYDIIEEGKLDVYKRQPPACCKSS